MPRILNMDASFSVSSRQKVGQTVSIGLGACICFKNTKPGRRLVLYAYLGARETGNALEVLRYSGTFLILRCVFNLNSCRVATTVKHVSTYTLSPLGLTPHHLLRY